MVPLVYAGIGKENSILKVNGNPEIKKHLEDLGFVAGSKVTVITETGGNVIVNVKNTRVAIDRRLASRIMV